MALSAKAPRAGDPFWDMLVHDARVLWGMNPRDFAAVMMYESIGIDPAALNPGGAAGINQITNPKNYAPLTRDQYLALDAGGQWDLAVRKFFDGVIKAHPSVKEGGARDLYWLNFVPATYKANAPDDYVIIEPTGQYGSPNSPLSGMAILKDNPSLILPQDKIAPVIRPASLTHALEQNFSSARWKEVLAAIDQAEKSTTDVAVNGPPTRPSAVQGPPFPPLPRAAEASMAGPAFVLGMVGLVAWANRRRLNRGRI